jgi:hypothetical protein
LSCRAGTDDGLKFDSILALSQLTGCLELLAIYSGICEHVFRFRLGVFLTNVHRIGFQVLRTYAVSGKDRRICLVLIALVLLRAGADVASRQFILTLGRPSQRFRSFRPTVNYDWLFSQWYQQRPEVRAPLSQL